MAAASLVCAFGAAGQVECGQWTSAARSADLGPNATVWRFLSVDLDIGSKLFACGQEFSVAGTSRRGYAVWDGQQWTPGEPMASVFGGQGIGRDAVQFEVDGRPQVVMAGNFDLIGLVPVANIAAFDGQEWSAMGGGLIFADVSGRVNSVEVVGSGPSTLYAGGLFDRSDGQPLRNIARWKGTSWEPLQGSSGVGVNGQVIDMVDWNGQLVVGGLFTQVGGLPADGVAMWSGSSWTPLPPAPGEVVDLEVFQNRVHVSVEIGNDIRVYRLDGTRWSDLATGSGFEDGRFMYADVQDGQERLYFGGYVRLPGGDTTSPCYWDGTQWQSLPVTLDRGVITFGRGLGLGGESELWMYGRFEEVAGIDTDRLAVYDGQQIRAASGGFDAWVRDVLVTGVGDQAVVYVAGEFGTAPGVDATSIAVRRDGQWEALGEFNGLIFDLIMFDGGQGPQLHACGRFTEVDGQPISGIARWDGASWQSLAEGIPGPTGFMPYVWTMAEYDDGRGPALYVGGQFTRAGLVPVSGLARWDGENWENVGRGADGDVTTLVTHMTSQGERLYVGGQFERVGGLAGVDVRNLAAWDGERWYDVAGGADGLIYTLASMDIDGEPTLFAGGQFDEVGDIPASRIAMLSSESEWSALGEGVDSSGFPYVIGLLPVVLEGRQAMLAGGLFSVAGGRVAGSLAAYAPGVGWVDVGGDFTTASGGITVVEAMATDESGERLWVGGDFELVSGKEAIRLAERDLACGCFADCDGDGSLTLFDFLCFQSAFDQGDMKADCDGDGSLTLFDFLCFQSGFDTGCP
ncbi:MAG: hypothetical protein ACIAS6_13770 [Phycisphaerales bacterium JB060]